MKEERHSEEGRKIYTFKDRDERDWRREKKSHNIILPNSSNIILLKRDKFKPKYNYDYLVILQCSFGWFYFPVFQTFCSVDILLL